MNKFGRIGLLAGIASAAISASRAPAETASDSGRHRGREPQTKAPRQSGKTSAFTSQRL